MPAPVWILIMDRIMEGIIMPEEMLDADAAFSRFG
jgi:hypothetical protein